MKNLGYSSKSKSKAKIVLNVDGTLQSDTYTVCNHVNKFFTSVAKDLTNKLPHVSNDYGIASDSFERFYPSIGVTINEFELRAVDEDLIYEELASLNIHKAAGLDDIAPRFLRDGAKQPAPLITHIVNLSIESAVVPQDLKFAKIVPLY